LALAAVSAETGADAGAELWAAGAEDAAGAAAAAAFSHSTAPLQLMPTTMAWILFFICMALPVIR
jgi:hypothetical protein